MNIIERSIYAIIDWITLNTDKQFENEEGQYNAMSIVYAVIILILFLAILRAFGII